MKATMFKICMLWLGIGMLFFTQCEKPEPLPPNPFDSIDRTLPVDTPPPLAKNSIMELHQRLFLPKCGQPGCHDGHFEPDFRTVQSSYSTLVYAPITKNNAANFFKYRVKPGVPSESVLYERITNCCFVNTNDRMPQDNIGQGLPDQDIADIADWISQGAPDMFGRLPSLPNTRPSVLFYVAFKSDFSVFYSTDSANRVDGIPYYPFWLPNQTQVTIAFRVIDDQTPTAQLQRNQLKLSLDMNNFNAAQTYQATYLNVPNQGEFWLVSFNTSSLNPNVIYYMRYYVHDGQVANTTEFPDASLPSFYKSFSAFKIQP